MESIPDSQTSSARHTLARLYLERLADRVTRIEFSYPAANLGLAEVCRDALASIAGMPSAEDYAIASADKDDSQHAIELLEAQQKLGLVPEHEYRRKRRELGRSLRQSRLTEIPVLQRLVGTGTSLLDGLDEGLETLGELAEKLYRRRVSLHAQT